MGGAQGRAEERAHAFAAVARTHLPQPRQPASLREIIERTAQRCYLDNFPETAVVLAPPRLMSSPVASSPSLLPPELQLGEPVTDAMHTEFVRLLDLAHDAPDAALVEALDAWIAHTREHFAQEERWMEALEFGPRHCHAGQHRHALHVAGLVRDEIAQNARFDLGRRLIGELREWFAFHVKTMDSMMIGHMRETGVAPVV